MNYRYEADGDIAVFALSGRLDATTSPAFEAAVTEKINAGAAKLLLDLAQLDYISSAGLRVMLLIAKKLKQTGGQVVLCCMQEQIQEVFDIAGFTPLFAITATVAEAKQQL